MRSRLFCVALAAACVACATPLKDSCPPPPGAASETVYAVSHGWHAGIVLPRAAIVAEQWPVAMDFPDAEYLELGWGERAFYMASDPHWSLAVRAALLPSPSVLHVVGFSGPVESYFPGSDIVEVRLSPSGLGRLSRHIASSFAVDDAGRLLPIGDGLYGHSRFYPSRETYHAFNTCNVWAARALRQAGCPVTPSSTVDGLMQQVRRFGSDLRGAPVKGKGAPRTAHSPRNAATRTRCPPAVARRDPVAFRIPWWTSASTSSRFEAPALTVAPDQANMHVAHL